mgnify:CR=1 FL=1
MCGVGNQNIHSGIDQGGGTLPCVTEVADRRTNHESAGGIFGRIRELLTLDEVLHSDQADAPILRIDHNKLFNAVLVQETLGFVLADAFARGRPALVQASLVYCLITLTDPSIAINSGLLRVAETKLREGSVVKQGEVLARLENRDVIATQQQAQANVALARANLDQAVAELNDAMRALERSRDLLAIMSVTRNPPMPISIARPATCRRGEVGTIMSAVAMRMTLTRPVVS